jgi:hypothetical protein
LIDPKEVERVEKILNQLAPRIQRWMTNLMEKEGHTVTLSVTANLGTSLLSSCLLMVLQKNGDVEQFMALMMRETGSKYLGAKALVDADRNAVMSEMVQSGWDTCRPLH